ncbi:MAG: restriction endonuclease subunit M [Planctomycetota bacterium]|nr:MAG: restriction endonuclease subunit M [Planctomycetota bacterium]
MPAPKTIHELVKHFDRNIEAYRSGRYKESQLRQEFINPFFEAFGWDVSNKNRYAEAYKDVIHEDSIRVAEGTKAPDYCFRIGGTRKFFLEAKKPSVDIKRDIHPAYQLRRYAWSSKLPLSILTDFEELAVYDCRIKPKKTDKASIGRIKYITYKDYIKEWEWIEGTFSREEILKGSFDKYAESAKRKRGTAEVDAAFLNEIESWREMLAKNIALRNKRLSIRNLNFAVQRIIDRIIFLRICEDRGIEKYGRLRDISKLANNYKELGVLFKHADDKYNSGLFYFRKEKGRGRPDEITLKLKVDDRPLMQIIKSLYYPDSPYEFSVLPADILGQVYEQFLGKVIRLTKSHRAIIDEKPEVKKAGGVYYTPTYIVDYIVENTVGKLLEKCRIPNEASKLKILDPACGSGSFLIGAFQYLIDWHQKYYTGQSRGKACLAPTKKAKIKKYSTGKSPKLYQAGKDDWRLTTGEKKRILLNNIYGVDIDPQAVEVTKLSLLLKVLEGENENTLQTQLLLFHERALPDLSSNIKCGNSLIGTDFYDSKQGELFPDEEERMRINAFDWDGKLGFPDIFKDGNPGFDAVIGNPPYIDSEWMSKYHPDTRSYCSSRYLSASGNWDIFCVFAEKAIDLCRKKGFSSFIVPNKIGSAPYAKSVSGILSIRNILQSIRDFSSVPVFPVSVYPIVYVAKREKPNSKSLVKYEKMNMENGKIYPDKAKMLNLHKYFSKHPWPVFGDISENSPVERLRNEYPLLQDVASVLGAATVSEAYEIKELISESTGTKKGGMVFINSGTIDRYLPLWGIKNTRYLKKKFNRPVVSITKKKRLPWKRREQAETRKLIVAGMTKILECIIDEKGNILAGKSTSIIFSDMELKYLLGLLNSRLISYFFINVHGGNKLAGGYLRIGPPQLRTIPIRTVDFTNKKDKEKHDRMVKLVEAMLDLNRKLPKAKTAHQKEVLHRQIDATDGRIDKLVYELYGLTKKEIKTVEEATNKG